MSAAKPTLRSAAHAVAACFDQAERTRGPFKPTFRNPATKERVENSVTIPVRLLRDLSNAAKREGV